LQTVVANGLGNYTATLAPGSYRLQILPQRAGYATQWYGGTSFANGTTVTMTAARTLNITVHV
jgi:hypothetical protein